MPIFRRSPRALSRWSRAPRPHFGRQRRTKGFELARRVQQSFGLRSHKGHRCLLMELVGGMGMPDFWWLKPPIPLDADRADQERSDARVGARRLAIC